MTQQEIELYISSMINQSLAGQDIEHPKLEFKSKWYDLKEEKTKAAFIKDTTAMANTVGLDGFIVIGYDESKQQFMPVQFSDCKLKDSSELPDIINRHVDRAFDIRYFPITVNGNPLNVLHIPPSLDKPHVIRLHRSWPNSGLKEEKHRVYVRKGTKIEEATKYDLDFMYYDRKNLQPEYELYTFIDLNNLRLGLSAKDHQIYSKAVDECSGNLTLTIENTGRRSVHITGITCTIGLSETDTTEDIELKSIEVLGTHAEDYVIATGNISLVTWIVNAPDLSGQQYTSIENKINRFNQIQEFHFIRSLKIHLITGQDITPKWQKAHKSRKEIQEGPSIF